MNVENVMHDEVAKIYNLLYEAHQLEDGKSKIIMTEEAVRLADIYGDEMSQVDARNDLVQAAVFGGEDEKAIVAFSWLCKKFEENPELMDPYEFLWRYKWIIHQIYGFPNISRPQIDAVFADATKHYTQNNVSLRPIYQNLCRLEMYSGNDEKAAEYYQQWQSAPRDWLADCVACEVNMQVEYQSNHENDEQAIEIARPILGGQMSCAEIPHGTYANVLMPFVRLGRFAQAEEAFNKGYKMVSKNRDFLPQITEHLKFLVLAGNLETAARVFEKHLSWALETKQLDYQFQFFNAAWLLFDALESSGEESIRLDLPKSFGQFNKDGDYDVGNLKEEFESDSIALARLFDARNQNDFYARAIVRNKKLKELAFALGKTGK
jgi:hypothetical protein